jgi:hypothetical protein
MEKHQQGQTCEACAIETNLFEVPTPCLMARTSRPFWVDNGGQTATMDLLVFEANPFELTECSMAPPRHGPAMS